MEGTFFDIISGSFQWTKTVLFKPFRIKKWLFLCVIALLAGEFSGCNTNFNLNLLDKKDEFKKTIQKDSDNNKDTSSLSFLGSQDSDPTEAYSDSAETEEDINISKNIKLAVVIMVILLIVGAIFVVFLAWVYSRFSFIFINSIVKNIASVKTPFTENAILGNSYFKWNMVMLFISILIAGFMVLLFIGGIYFLRETNIFVIIILSLLYVFVAVSVLLGLIVLNITVHDLILPVMFKNKIPIMQAWKIALPVLSQKKYDYFKYLLIKLGLRMLAGIAAVFLSAGIILAMLVPSGIVGGLLYSASLLFSGYLKIAYFVLLITLGIAWIVLVIFIINVILLPIPVFFRTFSIKFLARLDRKQDLFRLA